jgi:hypothetical protein
MLTNVQTGLSRRGSKFEFDCAVFEGPTNSRQAATIHCRVARLEEGISTADAEKLNQIRVLKLVKTYCQRNRDKTVGGQTTGSREAELGSTY